MQTRQDQTQAEAGKRDYVQPEFQKREQLKEITEGVAPVVVTPGGTPVARPV